jgi:hypothetical protein
MSYGEATYGLLQFILKPKDHSVVFFVHKKRGTIFHFLLEVCHKVSFKILPIHKMSMKHFPKGRNLNPYHASSLGHEKSKGRSKNSSVRFVIQ